MEVSSPWRPLRACVQATGTLGSGRRRERAEFQNSNTRRLLIHTALREVRTECLTYRRTRARSPRPLNCGDTTRCPTKSSVAGGEGGGEPPSQGTCSRALGKQRGRVTARISDAFVPHRLVLRLVVIRQNQFKKSSAWMCTESLQGRRTQHSCGKGLWGAQVAGGVVPGAGGHGRWPGCSGWKTWSLDELLGGCWWEDRKTWGLVPSIGNTVAEARGPER